MSGVVLWTRQFGSAELDYAFSIAPWGADVYVAGRAGGDLPGSTPPFQGGGSDGFVRKYNENGNNPPAWTQLIGTSAFDVAYGVAASSSGVYAVGNTHGDLNGLLGYSDAFIRKYNPDDGSSPWTRQFGSVSGDDVAYGVAATADGSSVYAVGYMFGFPGSNSDAFVRKYDANGNFVWASLFGSPTNDIAFGVSVGASGIYVAGRTSGTLPGQASFGAADAFLRKYDAAGNHVWTRQFGTTFDDQALGTAIDGTGVYVVGDTGGPLVPGGHLGSFDAFVRKYSADGTELWTRQFGTPMFDRANGVAAEGNDPLVVGRTAGALPGWANLGGDDAFLRRYDVNGAVLWTNQFGTSVADDASSVVFSQMYVAGATSGTLPGQTSAGNFDGFLNRWSEVGGCPPICPERPSAEP